jgi:multisubunit Na+/H+ antiporter MnhE subunit
MFAPVRKGGLLAAAVAMTMTMTAAPAQAAMGCWGESEVGAARVRDLQSRLMVSAMRCRAMGIDILAAYNEFVRVNRSTIQAANMVIRGRFDSGFGAVSGQTEYDRFTTALANAYGADPTSDETCAEAASVAAEAVAAEGDHLRLVAIEERLGPAPELPGGRCPASFAATLTFE